MLVACFRLAVMKTDQLQARFRSYAEAAITRRRSSFRDVLNPFRKYSFIHGIASRLPVHRLLAVTGSRVYVEFAAGKLRLRQSFYVPKNELAGFLADCERYRATKDPLASTTEIRDELQPPSGR